MGIQPLHAYGFSVDDIPLLARQAMEDTSTPSNPVRPEEGEVERLIAKAYCEGLVAEAVRRQQGRVKEDGEMSEQKIVVPERKAQLVSAHVIYEMTGRLFVPAASSNRHVHLSEEDLARLFGRGYALTPQKDLSQPGQYAAKETVTLVGPKGEIQKVRVLGPVRKDTQVEISRTDSFKLGVKPVVRMSGDVAGTPGSGWWGPEGRSTSPRA